MAVKDGSGRRYINPDKNSDINININNKNPISPILIKKNAAPNAEPNAKN